MNPTSYRMKKQKVDLDDNDRIHLKRKIADEAILKDAIILLRRAAVRHTTQCPICNDMHTNYLCLFYQNKAAVAWLRLEQQKDPFDFLGTADEAQTLAQDVFVSLIKLLEGRLECVAEEPIPLAKSTKDNFRQEAVDSLHSAAVSKRQSQPGFIMAHILHHSNIRNVSRSQSILKQNLPCLNCGTLLQKQE